MVKDHIPGNKTLKWPCLFHLGQGHALESRCLIVQTENNCKELKVLKKRKHQTCLPGRQNAVINHLHPSWAGILFCIITMCISWNTVRSVVAYLFWKGEKCSILTIINGDISKREVGWGRETDEAPAYLAFSWKHSFINQEHPAGVLARLYSPCLSTGSSLFQKSDTSSRCPWGWSKNNSFVYFYQWS